MNTQYLNEAVARQRTADLGRRTRRAQHPVVHPPTTPRGGIVLALGWLTRPSQVLPGSPA
ncbi:hypothetical protein [Terrabacter terrigena]|uniref:Uncharacterized protein n=1 Tax=Terrabacter terrigena TaxID=574718 RepID=A0ABW3N3J3_9MICO